MNSVIADILSVTNERLNSITIKHPIVDLMDGHKNWFYLESGKEHYRLLHYISNLYSNSLLMDIGTLHGCSAISLASNKSNKVISYDVIKHEYVDLITEPNIEFRIGNAIESKELLEAKFILIDTNHDGVFEAQIIEYLNAQHWHGILMLDDIHLDQYHPDLAKLWRIITLEKHDLTNIGHWSGTGLILL